jgi:hypothetical protein
LEAKWVGGKLEVLRDRRTRRKPNRDRPRLIPNHPRNEVDLLPLNARAGNHEAVAAFSAYIYDETQLRDRNVCRSKRITRFVGHATSDGHGLVLRPSQSWREHERESGRDPSTCLTHLTGHSPPPRCFPSMIIVNTKNR